MKRIKLILSNDRDCNDKIWFLVPSDITNMKQLTKSIQKNVQDNVFVGTSSKSKCIIGKLEMSGYVLPMYESIDLLRDGDEVIAHYHSKKRKLDAMLASGLQTTIYYDFTFFSKY